MCINKKTTILVTENIAIKLIDPSHVANKNRITAANIANAV
jgi:hypothetical protein